MSSDFSIIEKESYDLLTTDKINVLFLEKKGNSYTVVPSYRDGVIIFIKNTNNDEKQKEINENYFKEHRQHAESVRQSIDESASFTPPPVVVGTFIEEPQFLRLRAIRGQNNLDNIGINYESMEDMMSSNYTDLILKRGINVKNTRKHFSLKNITNKQDLRLYKKNNISEWKIIEPYNKRINDTYMSLPIKDTIYTTSSDICDLFDELGGIIKKVNHFFNKYDEILLSEQSEFGIFEDMLDNSTANFTYGRENNYSIFKLLKVRGILLRDIKILVNKKGPWPYGKGGVNINCKKESTVINDLQMDMTLIDIDSKYVILLTLYKNDSLTKSSDNDKQTRLEKEIRNEEIKLLKLEREIKENKRKPTTHSRMKYRVKKKKKKEKKKEKEKEEKEEEKKIKHVVGVKELTVSEAVAVAVAVGKK